MILNRHTIYISLLTIGFIASCTVPKKVQQPSASSPVAVIDTAAVNNEDAFFGHIFSSYPGVFDAVLKNRSALNVQIIYTEIFRNGKETPVLVDHYFNMNNPAYFYPASTIKLPVALLALEKAARIGTKLQKDITNASMITEAAFNGQSAVYNDPNTRDGRPTIAQYVKKIFLVSDNDAFNRLYEFVGQEEINEQLHKKGYKDAQVLHRLDVFLSEDENRHTNPVGFYDTSGNVLYEQPLLFNKKIYAKRNEVLGNGYYSKGKLVNKPMSFSGKNRVSLQDLHTMFRSVIFPQAVPASQRFNLSENDRLFVMKYMSQFPRESQFPSYDSSYADGYAKAIMYGNDRNPLPGNIRIFNKSGTAYGQLVDVAYVMDAKNNIEFMVSAAIYCNSDGILNDDTYDYDTIGYPFLKNLGKALYNYEAKRKKNYIPDFSPFIFAYDK